MGFYKLIGVFILCFALFQMLLAKNQKEIPPQKLCNFRGTIYPEDSWNLITGFYCYDYTNPFRLKFKFEYKATGIGISLDGKTFYFDYKNATSNAIIRQSYKTDDFFNLWIDCCLQAVDCCQNHMSNENILPTEEYACPAEWDAWSCFPPAKASTTAKLQCSKQAYSNSASFCIQYSEKECYPTGWNPNTSYRTCTIAPVFSNRHNFHVYVLIAGSILSLPALIIFCVFAKFRAIFRVSCHRNLILIVIVRNILTIMTKEIILLDALKSESASNHVMDHNSVACRVLAFFENAAKNGMYACMLADGFYLHKLIVRTFAPEPSLYLIYGCILGIMFVPSLIWATLKGVNGGDQCWMVDTTSDQWISNGLRIAILAINMCLLLDIIRCMCFKRKNKKTSKQARETLHATLFLMPLFGIHILFISNRNMFGSNPTCSHEDIYYYISYSIEGMQSVLVAITFCYLNTEVHAEMKNAYRKLLLHLEQRFGWTGLRRNTTNRRRRTTAATYVEPEGDNRPRKTINEINASFFQTENNESQI